MRSIGPELTPLLAAVVYNSLRLEPDQNSRSNTSLSDLTRCNANILRKIADQLATSSQDPPTRVDYGAMTVRLIVLAIILGVALAINAFA